MSKPKGKCPYCQEFMTPVVVEENAICRDKCKCSKCGEYIYICRTPGCHNYAKGGELWDDELCPECTSSVGRIAKDIATAALITGVGTLVGKFLSENDNGGSNGISILDGIEPIDIDQ